MHGFITLLVLWALWICSSCLATISEPFHHRKLYEKALVYLRAGDHVSAANMLVLAIDQDDDNGEYHQLLGSLYMSLAENELACEHLEKALLSLGWENPKTLVVSNYIEALRRAGMMERARTAAGKSKPKV
tara:strand:- start:184 stop:576 length:393 start_codon:yes stop_codon:yes gene_type:complete